MGTIHVGGQTRVYSLDRHDFADASARLPIVIFLPGASIAATAIVRHLVVVTRDVKDFNDTGVAPINPWSP